MCYQQYSTWVNSAANIKTEITAYFNVAILNKYVSLNRNVTAVTSVRFLSSKIFADLIINFNLNLCFRYRNIQKKLNFKIFRQIKKIIFCLF